MPGQPPLQSAVASQPTDQEPLVRSCRPAGTLRQLARGLSLPLLFCLLPAPALAVAQESSGLWRSQAGGASYDGPSLLRRAEQGDSRAAYLLGIRFASGSGEVRDDSEAMRWFRLAAERGLAEAQYNLGIMYATGRGAARNYAEAARWYRLAADQGITEAQFNLGTLYGKGRGVPRDDRTAVEWLTKAAEGGLAEAQFNLGVMHEFGRGVRISGPLALKWYERAAAQGYEKAGGRLRALREKLDAGQNLTGPRAPAPPQNSPAAPSAAGKAAPVERSAENRESRTEAGPPRDTSGIKPGASAGWLAGREPERYTLQLLSDTNRRSVERFVSRNFPDGDAGIYVNRRDGKTWYSVVHGDFATYGEAKAAITNLPAKLRRDKPWARKVAAILKSLKKSD